ncbi:hypothetical protein CHS0354_005494 [Potamilus streckersoni]|uniref:RRM domain-containing protein n=1 Tax=Potamilus streckersoni TaxID=2493646 RepID=A0AAE0VVV8_9BIVA|nr:hypothetical protein CHS0354_005494 [Potamilus streckersoni]
MQTGYNMCYCLVSYRKKDDAHWASWMLAKSEVRPGRTLKTHIRITKARLYVRHIPKDMSPKELKDEFEKIAPGIEDVIVLTTPEMRKIRLKNKGFCFVDYTDHQQATAAKKNLKSGGSSLFGCNIVVDWAKPRDELDDEFMSMVTINEKNLLTVISTRTFTNGKGTIKFTVSFYEKGKALM